MPADDQGPVASTLPLRIEEVSVLARQRQGDTVQVSTVTRHHERLVEQDLVHDRVEIDIVPIGRWIDVAPPVREDGDTTIVPVVEEIVVVERRLVLKEEVRIRRVRVTETHRETVTVREQDAVVTRAEAGTNQPNRSGEPQ